MNYDSFRDWQDDVNSNRTFTHYKNVQYLHN